MHDGVNVSVTHEWRSKGDRSNDEVKVVECVRENE